MGKSHLAARAEYRLANLRARCERRWRAVLIAFVVLVGMNLVLLVYSAVSLVNQPVFTETSWMTDEAQKACVIDLLSRDEAQDTTFAAGVCSRLYDLNPEGFTEAYGDPT